MSKMAFIGVYRYHIGRYEKKLISRTLSGTTDINLNCSYLDFQPRANEQPFNPWSTLQGEEKYMNCVVAFTRR